MSDAAPPHRAEHPEIPAEHAITGIVGARAYGAAGEHPLLTETLGFTDLGGGEFRVGEFTRWAYDPAPPERGLNGAGTVHHIAWASRDEDHLAWRQRLQAAGVGVTGVRDRDYFRSIYFREPRGILFEIATLSPGLRGRRGPGAPRRGAAPARAARAPARPARADAHPVTNPRSARARGQP